MDMEKKKSRTWVHVLVGFLLGVVLLGGVCYFLYSQNYLSFGNNSVAEQNQSKDKEIENSSKVSMMKLIHFDASKCQNSNADSYTLTIPTHSLGTNVSLDSAQKKVTVSVNRHLVNVAYGLNWETSSQNYEELLHEITFEQKVDEIFFSGIGQDGSYDTILFLMEDGSLEYLPVRKSLEENYEQLKSYGKLSGVSQIVKLYAANANRNPVGSGITILAQKTDGTFYDLSTILQNTGNY